MDIKQAASLISRLGLQAENRISLLDWAGLEKAHVPSFPPDCPALILGLKAGSSAALERILRQVYPPTFKLHLVQAESVSLISLADLPGSSAEAVLVPALAAGTSFEIFQETIAHLRAPEDGCPWDKEQTHLSLRKHLLEETYETISALDENDPQKTSEELGDLLLQILMHAQIAAETGEFNMAAVIQGIYEKLIRRHPHVFGEVEVEGVGEVLSNWEKIKAAERKKGGMEHKGLLDGLPSDLPALSKAHEYQSRAARVGFDWPEVAGVLDKIREEIDEVLAATNESELNDEFGDLFFALVNLARWKKVDAEAALRGTNLKFKRRFKYIEEHARASGRSLPDLNLAEMDALWNEAKRAEKTDPD